MINTLGRFSADYFFHIMLGIMIGMFVDPNCCDPYHIKIIIILYAGMYASFAVANVICHVGGCGFLLKGTIQGIVAISSGMVLGIIYFNSIPWIADQIKIFQSKIL